MNIRNDTDLELIAFPYVDDEDTLSTVVACRGTFTWRNGHGLQQSSVQQSIVMSDEYLGDPLGSSLKYDSDLSPPKPAIDVLIDATAYAPGGRPTAAWDVSIAIGSIEKCLTVTGPRMVQHNQGGGIRLSDPLDTSCVELRYEMAWGGRCVCAETEHICSENPAGSGFANCLVERSTQRPRGPQIFYPSDLYAGDASELRVAGFGPVARHWAPRRHLCGTADSEWLKSRWPLRPRDFSPFFYNCAPIDMRLQPTRSLDLEVTLRGIHPNGDRHFHIATEEIVTLGTSSGRYAIAAMQPDTIYIRTDPDEVVIVWRSMLRGLGSCDFVHAATRTGGGVAKSGYELARRGHG